MKNLHGTVTAFDGTYYVVTSPDAPAHLRTLNLLRWQVAGATVGDRVELAYQSRPGCSLWNVVKVN